MKNVTDRADRRKFHIIYKTTHIASGKFYVGMHSTNNLEDGYMGSGKRIRHLLNKYGKEAHHFEILEFLSDRKLLAAREKEIVNEELLKNHLCVNLTVGGHGGWHTARKIHIDKLKNDPDYRSHHKAIGKIRGIALAEKIKSNHHFGLLFKLKSRQNRVVFKEKFKDEADYKSHFKSIGKIGGDATAEKYKNDPKYKEQFKLMSALGNAVISEKRKNDEVYRNYRKAESRKAGLATAERLKNDPLLMENRRQQCSSLGAGKIWITTGTENKRIPKFEAIPSGWRKGRKIKQ